VGIEGLFRPEQMAVPFELKQVLAAVVRLHTPIYFHITVVERVADADRRLFPGCWDIAGGHVDPGETFDAALAREIREETGWRLRRFVRFVAIVDWEAKRQGQVVAKREFNFLLEVDGDLTAPAIEAEKFSIFRWVGRDELALLDENRREGDTMIRQLVPKGLELAAG